MGGKVRYFHIGAIFVLLLLSFGMFGTTTEAHPLKCLLKLDSSFRGSMEGPVGRLSLRYRMIKHPGPSQRGEGHKSRKGRNLLLHNIKKDSGPSRGDGHENFSRMHH
jgi:hypothetical protein